MLLYVWNNVVLATHEESQNVPPSTYGQGVVLVPWRDAPPPLGEIVPPLTKPQLHEIAASYRWQRETAGITVNGLHVPTDERTRNVLTAAYVKAKADPTYVIARWKLGPGVYGSLDAATIIALADAVEAHVQACFAANADVDAAIEIGSILTIGHIQEAAWP